MDQPQDLEIGDMNIGLGVFMGLVKLGRRISRPDSISKIQAQIWSKVNAGQSALPASNISLHI